MEGEDDERRKEKKETRLRRQAERDRGRNSLASEKTEGKRGGVEERPREDREINVENVNTRVVVRKGRVDEGFKLGTAFQDPVVRPSVRSFIPFLESGSAPLRERHE